MEGLEVEDISPALEATEDYLHGPDGVQDDGQVRPPKLKEVSALDELSSSGVWGLLSGGQAEMSSHRLAWAEQTSSFGVLGLRSGKRNRARSTNDLAAHAKENNSTSNTSGGFKRGHNRSRSDVNNRTYMDNGVPAVDKNTLKNMALNNQQEANKESSPSVVKQGVLDQREGAWGRWCACHVELTPCELRLYSLDSSGNRQLCTALSLSHCQAVGAPLPQDGRVLQALFFNSTRLQLRAPCQREALEWRRLLWERVVAARPARQQEEEPPAAQGPPRERASDARPPRPKALPLYTQRCPEALKAGVLYQLSDLNNWSAFTFVLGRTCLQAFPTEGRGPVSEPVMQYTLASCLAVQRDEAEGGGRARFQAVFPDEVLRLRAESELKAQDWVEALRAAVASQRTQADGGQPAAPGVLMRSRPARERQQRGTQRAKRQSVTTSFLSILTCLAVEKGLTAQSFRCAGCQRLVGLSRGKAKVCCYSGWYYCQSCHQDNLFLIPARLLHNWDTNKHKVSKQAKEFLEFIYEEPLLDVQQLNPCLYEHAEPLATVLRLRQQLQSLRAYLFSCRATVAEDLRRRIFPREYLLQHIHLYSLADLQQVIDGKLAPFLSKVIKFASSHVYSCSLCREKGFVCELCQNGQILYPFQENATKRCEGCGAVFHAECRLRAQPCPRCVRRELHKKPSSFWRRHNRCDSPDDDLSGCFELDT
ncbi:pleckstrin homology domain-containing family M member 3 [Electrophorus electricus]|uniref:PH domain-containing protein n=1 Tax=Electrophorus electricus TaxID=8005 RepID=A0AAY5F3A8_ELEEL|nr:pleckstrin homology domain-containing family M member 3 [Electrophorus electricus]